MVSKNSIGEIERILTPLAEKGYEVRTESIYDIRSEGAEHELRICISRPGRR